MKYTHIGRYKTDAKFNMTKFQPIKNINGFSKPDGGYWASSVDAPYGWMTWCEDEEPDWISDDVFTFELTPSAKVLRIESKDDIPFTYVDHRFVDEKRLSLIKQNSGFLISPIPLNFEKLARDYDAIEILAGSNMDLYYAFYGWDCDSILITNPSIIKESGNSGGKE